MNFGGAVEIDVAKISCCEADLTIITLILTLIIRNVVFLLLSGSSGGVERTGG